MLSFVLGRKSPLHVLGCLHFPNGFLFLVSIWLLDTCRPTHLFVSDRTTSPSLSLQCVCCSPGRKHANPHPPMEVPICPVQVIHNDAHVSALSVSSSGPFLIDPRGPPLFALWSSYLKRLCTFPQMTHFQITMIVHYSKILKPSIITFLLRSEKLVTRICIGMSPSFCSFANNLSAFDQDFTQTLRYRMRFENLGLTCTFTCLHHNLLGALQSYVSPHRAPPAAVLLPS